MDKLLALFCNTLAPTECDMFWSLLEAKKKDVQHALNTLPLTASEAKKERDLLAVIQEIQEALRAEKLGNIGQDVYNLQIDSLDMSEHLVNDFLAK